MHFCVRGTLQKTVGGHLANVKHPSLGSGPLHAEAGERGPPSLILLGLLVAVFSYYCYVIVIVVKLYCTVIMLLLWQFNVNSVLSGHGQSEGNISCCGFV